MQERNNRPDAQVACVVAHTAVVSAVRLLGGLRLCSAAMSLCPKQPISDLQETFYDIVPTSTAVPNLALVSANIPSWFEWHDLCH